MDDFIQTCIDFAQLAALAFMAAGAKVAHRYLHGGEFTLPVFISFFVIAVFAAWLMGSLLPPDFAYRNVCLGIAAWSGGELIRLLEKRITTKAEDILK